MDTTTTHPLATAPTPAAVQRQADPAPELPKRLPAQPPLRVDEATVPALFITRWCGPNRRLPAGGAA